MDEQNQNQNNMPTADTANVPAPVPPPVSGDELMIVSDGLSPERERNSPADPERVMEFDATDHGDESMRGGYASVNGKEKRSDNRLVWIVLIVMSVMCIAVGVCSALLTARFMQKGDRPPIVSTNGQIQQNITAIVSARKSSIAEVRCGGLSSSGVVMKRDGNDVTVLTNAHAIANYVVSDRQTPVWVRLFGEDDYFRATVVGYDGHYDVAVLNVVVEGLAYTVYNIDGSDVLTPNVEYKEGDYVVSIGNAMSMGIASYDGIISRGSELLECNELFGAEGKKVVPVLRTTAVINAGMSGGGVFDMQGRLIGLGTYRMSNTAGIDTDGGTATDVENTGFATPISIVYPIYKRILKTADGGAVGLFAVNTQKSNSAIGWIGLPLLGLNCEYNHGKLVVDSVTTDAANGIEEGDIITAIGDVKVTSDICAVTGALLGYHKSGTGAALKLSVSRGDSSFAKTYDGLRYAV